MPYHRWCQQIANVSSKRRPALVCHAVRAWHAKHFFFRTGPFRPDYPKGSALQNSRQFILQFSGTLRVLCGVATVSVKQMICRTSSPAYASKKSSRYIWTIPGGRYSFNSGTAAKAIVVSACILAWSLKRAPILSTVCLFWTRCSPLQYCQVCVCS